MRSFLGYFRFHHSDPVASVLRVLELGAVGVRRQDRVRRPLLDVLSVVRLRTRPSPDITVQTALRDFTSTSASEVDRGVHILISIVADKPSRVAVTPKSGGILKSE